VPNDRPSLRLRECLAVRDLSLDAQLCAVAVRRGTRVNPRPRPRLHTQTLGHRGLLFMDELPEFARHALEALRQPLKEGGV
jgi:predicted ATPase with chaperone activity